MLLNAKLRAGDKEHSEVFFVCNSASDVSKYLNYKRINFFIGKNNSGKSMFLRYLMNDFDFYRCLFFDRDSYELVSNNKLVSDFEKFWFEKSKKLTHIRDSFFADMLNRPYMLSELLDLSKDLGGRYNALFESIHELNFLRDFVKQVEFLRKLNVEKSHTTVYYIPVLRGLRSIGVGENEKPYEKRTAKDYSIRCSVLTGEDLYVSIRNCLLGEPEERDLIKSYEEKITSYFFEGNEVALIPKHNSDVLHIKIGADKQYPIHQLGDGLQQAIILTYQAFISKDKIFAFFIEEPELHMHAGMLRQLMNFYLNETKHYYFFTTHSNHLLDMVDESDEVVIQKFTKKKKDDGSAYFEIKRCDKDRELLAALGVRPSSVYLANCTIWVEGIADRLYLTKYMQRYLYDLEHSGEGNKAKFLKYRKFMQNFHYSFVEYQGSNLTHWSFDDDDQEEAPEADRRMKALDVCPNMLLIADGDIREKERVDDLQHELGNRFVLLESKEIENTLPASLVFDWAITKFEGAKSKTKEGFDIQKLIEEKDNNAYLQNQNRGIGVLLDDLMREEGTPADKSVFAEKSGTIKKKTDFCTDMLAKMGDRTYWDSVRNPDANDQTLWQLTDEARRLCEQIFEFIDEMNQEIVGAASHAP